MRLIRALLLTVVVYGFAGWAYIAGNAIVHPQSLAWPLTHLAPWPREDSFGVACFISSATAFFLYRLLVSGDRRS